MTTSDRDTVAAYVHAALDELNIPRVNGTIQMRLDWLKRARLWTVQVDDEDGNTWEQQVFRPERPGQHDIRRAFAHWSSPPPDMLHPRVTDDPPLPLANLALE